MDLFISIVNAIEKGIFWLFVNDNYKIVFFIFIVVNVFLLYIMLLSGLELRWLKTAKIKNRKRKRRIDHEIIKLIDCDENSTYDIDEMITKENLFSFPIASFIRVITNSFTGLGVLGTFVGLQMALEQFNRSDIANFNFAIIGSMTTALKSSILGIFLSFVFMMVLKMVEIYVENSLKYVKDLMISENPLLSPSYQVHRFGQFMQNIEEQFDITNNSRILPKESIGQFTENLKELDKVLKMQSETIARQNQTLANQAEFIKKYEKYVTQQTKISDKSQDV